MESLPLRYILEMKMGGLVIRLVMDINGVLQGRIIFSKATD